MGACNRVGDSLRAGAGIAGADRDRRWRDVRQLVDAEAEIGNAADDGDDQRQHRRKDRPIDKEAAGSHRGRPPALARPFIRGTFVGGVALAGSDDDTVRATPIGRYALAGPGAVQALGDDPVAVGNALADPRASHRPAGTQLNVAARHHAAWSATT